jgi:hypothetical protein
VHLLYLDDSGSAGNPGEEYLVLGGVSVYEAQADWITSELDKVAQTFDAANPHDLEFHASEIFSRREAPWSRLTKDDARGAIKSVLRVLANSYDTARAFACAVHKKSFPTRDPMELAFEELCNRFDRYLSRLRAAGDRQRGLVILDESAHETSLQAMARQFRRLGTAWGVVRNLADTPMFINSRASRVVQLADHIAYAVYRRYEHGDTQYFDVIAPRFDAADGVVHGLVHRQNTDPRCMCLACVTRR